MSLLRNIFLKTHTSFFESRLVIHHSFYIYSTSVLVIFYHLLAKKFNILLR